MILENPFESLSTEELDLLTDAIPLITILIGGADGNIDHDEMEWAKKVTEIRKYNNPDLLHSFYELVGEKYDNQIKQYIANLPDDVDARTKEISDKMSMINDILPKLPIDYQEELYKSYVSFAHHVAKASGGVLRFFNVSSEEKALMDLPMLTPIINEA